MRFLCDQMLIALGRWLRVAGYDTIIIVKSIDDAEIYVMAQADKRLLLTRDHHFLEMTGAKQTVCYLNSNSLTECIQELTHKLSIDWLHNPFSRCLVCNTPFVAATDPDLLKDVPPDVLKQAVEISYCSACDKLYWQGTHTARMREKLIEWADKTKNQNEFF